MDIIHSGILMESREYFQGTLNDIEIIENKKLRHFIYI